MGRIVPDTMENKSIHIWNHQPVHHHIPIVVGLYPIKPLINITFNHHGKRDNLCRESPIVFVAWKHFFPTSSQDPRLEAGGLWIGFIKRPNLYPQR